MWPCEHQCITQYFNTLLLFIDKITVLKNMTKIFYFL